VSFNTLEYRKSIFCKGIIIDSGSFTRIKLGREVADYRRLIDTAIINDARIVFVPDYMCETNIRAIGGYSVETAIRRTTRNTIDMLKYAEKIGFDTKRIGRVVQGWNVEDYIRHIDLMLKKKVIEDKKDCVIGIGSVCRRNATLNIVNIIKAIRKRLPNAYLHAFGVKGDTLPYINRLVDSADSFAWAIGSWHAKRDGRPVCGRFGCEKNCVHCEEAVKIFYDKMIKKCKYFISNLEIF